MDILDDEIIAQLKLRQAVHVICMCGVVDVDFLTVRPRHICRGSSIFDSMTVIREWIGAGAVDALTVVFLQAGEIAVRDGDQLLS